MSKVSRKRRQFKIKRGGRRRKKIKKLKEKYFAIKSKTEKDKIIEKIKRIAPHFETEQMKEK